MPNLLITRILIVLVFMAPSLTFAASIRFETQGVGQDGTAYIGVYLDPSGLSINAVSGSLNLRDADIKNIITGNTSINYWVESPHIEDKSIIFSGITPGGLQLESLLFTVVIDARQGEQYNISGSNALSLLNDGLGTEVKLDTPQDLRIESSGESFVDTDVEPPEAFTPIYVKDENVFDGDDVIIFYSQDKGSGILKYEIKEGLFGKFKESRSPYRIKSQIFKTIVFVKAVDMQGNARTESVWVADYKMYLPFAIILTIIILAIRLKKTKK